MLIDYAPYFWKGTKVTVLLSLNAVILGAALAAALAFMKMSKYKVVSKVAAVYIDVIRGTPLIVQLWIVYLQLSKLIAFPDVIIGGVDMTRYLPCLIALTMNSGAYVAEIIRGGIQSVEKGQTEAARSLGMNHWMSMRLVILPQAIRTILPAIGNELVTMIKETAIIQYLGIADIMYARNTVATITYSILPSYYVAAIIYLLLNIVSTRGIRVWERKLQKAYN
ncbi:MAG: amino acid ABC transporter permease [Eubacteriales bacterium]|jgi:polar amino acid transport system permease protein|nr:amino acid ABC transporter permease [Eubacteriales bacterium]MDD4445168.1 amino acid ABC transporter permease [Eubacteriales bacterium]